MKYVDPPFELGETLSGKDADGNLINKDVLGKIFEFPANRLDASIYRGNKSRRTGRSIVAVALRNESGWTLQPKRLVQLTETAGYSLMESVDGYASITAEDHCVIVDEFVTNVADDDIFWGILQGPVIVKTSYDTMTAQIAVGDRLVSATCGSTSGNSTHGGVHLIGASTNNNMVLNLIGTALSAKVTADTNVDILINAQIRY